ncbi:MAG: hypothetical protein ACOX1Q_05625 [Eubacteriales bacterium]
MKKTLAALLCILLTVGLLAACGDSGESAPSKDPDTASTQPGSETAAPEELSLPFAEELTTYTVWSDMMSGMTIMETPNQSKAYQKAEEITNIHIEWKIASMGEGKEQFNLIMVSQNLPDAFFTGNAIGPSCYYVGGYDNYINEGLIRDLSDLIATYAPNYNALRYADDTVRKNTMTDSGKVPYFRTISPEREPTWVGVYARQDWLDKSGTGIVANNVETYEEFHDMLVALKDYSGTASYYLWSGSTGAEEFLMTGYGVLSEYINRDGRAVFCPTDPGYLEYLEMMNQWYSEGLIDPEFYVRAGLFGGDSALIINGEFGAFQFIYDTTMIEMQIPPEQGANIQGVTAPAINKGDIRKLAYNSVPHTVLGGGNATITYTSEDIVPFIKWMDYFYSEEGALLGNWGIEGVSYEIGEDGKPRWMEVIYANPDGTSTEDMQSLNTMPPVHPKLYYWERGFSPTLPEKAFKVGKEIWDRNYEDSETMPEVSISIDESAEYSSKMGDIKTYVTENTIKFITGEKSLSEWNSYVEWINSHGIDRCTEIMQNALDRYYKR